MPDRSDELLGTDRSDELLGTPAPSTTGEQMVAPPKYPALRSPKAYGARSLSKPQRQEEAGIALDKLKTAANIGLTVGGMETGGALTATKPILARILARGAGYFTGNTLGKMVESGQPPTMESLKQSGIDAAKNMALEGLARPVAYGLARTGTVDPRAASLAQDDFGLMTKLEPNEYKVAASDIAKHAGNLPQTPEHFGYNMLAQARGNVNGMAFVSRMLNHVRGNVDEPVSRLIERKTASLADDLFNRLGPGGEIQASELDDWIRKNLTEPASKVWEGGAGTAWQERLATMRDDLSPQLYRQIGGKAAEWQAETNRQLNIKEGVQKWLPEQTPQKPNIATPGKLRAILSEGDAGQETRDRLSAYDAQNKTNFSDRVKRLAMRSSWTAHEKEEIEQIMANIPTVKYERIGLMKSGGRAMGRGLTRSIRPGVAALTAKRVTSEASPEDNFSGMTNVTRPEVNP